MVNLRKVLSSFIVVLSMLISCEPQGRTQTINLGSVVKGLTGGGGLPNPLGGGALPNPLDGGGLLNPLGGLLNPLGGGGGGLLGLASPSLVCSNGKVSILGSLMPGGSLVPGLLGQRCGASLNIPACVSSLLPSAFGFPPDFKGCLSPDGKILLPQPPLVPVQMAVQYSTFPPPPLPKIGSPNQTIDWIKLSQLTCTSGWHQTCDGSISVDVPNAYWQVCAPIFTVSINNGPTTNSAEVAHRWFAADPVEPVGFRSYIFSLQSSGNNIPPALTLPSLGSEIALSAVGLRLIPATATLAERVQDGCDFPGGP